MASTSWTPPVLNTQQQQLLMQQQQLLPQPMLTPQQIQQQQLMLQQQFLWQQQQMQQQSALAAKEKAKAKLNREHAKKSREKRKKELSSLEEDLAELQREHGCLKRLIQDHFPADDAKTALQGENGEANSDLHRSDYELLQSLAGTGGNSSHHRHPQSYVITDPRLPDNPIVYVSDKFCELTGFTREQAVGRNCRFLQGPQTDPKALEVYRKGIQEGKDCTAVLLNYKADGTPFWNCCFVAALRDSHNNIVNYVGVQSERENPGLGASCHDDHVIMSEDGRPVKKRKMEPLVPMERLPLVPTSMGMQAAANRSNQTTLDEDEEVEEDDGNSALDWALLARALEADFDSSELQRHDDYLAGDTLDNGDLMSTSSGGVNSTISGTVTNPFCKLYDVDDEPIPLTINEKDKTPKQLQLQLQQEVKTQSFHESYLDRFTSSRREIISRTVRSDLIHSLLNSHGDVTNQTFVTTLPILEALYSNKCKSRTAMTAEESAKVDQYTKTWRTISRPHYGGCLGRNEDGDFMYTLGKLSFDMFKPGALKCSIQRTLNHIELVCEMDGAPKAAPWSLRRELAAWDPDTAKEAGSEGVGSTLKSYDIAVALTVEPDGKKPLKALNVTKGYMLPDPDTPNRLTVFFTGGELSHVSPDKKEDQEKYGNLEDWKALFGGDHKRTWGESFRVMGAKLLLGAELLDGTDQNGTMRYNLHRPIGGHGRAYVDVLYLDEDVLILKSSSGILHVMVRCNAEKKRKKETDTKTAAVVSS